MRSTFNYASTRINYYNCYFMLDNTTNEDVVRSCTDAMQVLKSAVTEIFSKQYITHNGNSLYRM